MKKMIQEMLVQQSLRSSQLDIPKHPTLYPNETVVQYSADIKRYHVTLCYKNIHTHYSSTFFPYFLMKT